MTLSLSTFALGWWFAGPAGEWPLRTGEFLLRARGWGFDTVQLADNCHPESWSWSDHEAVAAAARHLGLRVEWGCRPLTEKNLRFHLDLCALYGASVLRVVVDGAGHEPAPAEVVTLLRSAVPLLERNGVVLAVENHDRFPSAVLASILREADAAVVGACLDTANSLGAGEGLEWVAGHLAPWVVNIHLKDVRIRRFDHAQGFTVEGVALGRGILGRDQFHRLCGPMRRLRGVTLEQWTPPAPTLAETLEREMRSLEASLPVLDEWFPGLRQSGE